MSGVTVPRPRALLVVTLLAGLLLRLGWGLVQPRDEAGLAALPDQVEYLALGRSVLNAGAFAFHDGRFDDTVYAFRTPGYPLLVAACGGSPLVVRVVQALIDTSTALAAYLLARRWLAERSAVLAAALVAFNPFLVYFSGLILSETLFTAMLTWGALLLLSPGRWWPAAFVLAAAALVRPSAILLTPVLAAAVPGLRWSHRLTYAAAAFGLTIAVLLPWGWRNNRVLGRWVLTTTNGGITLYDGFHPAATGASDQSFVRRMPELSEMTELQRNDYLEHAAGRYMQNNPGRSVRLGLVKLARTWSPIPLSDEYGRTSYRLVGLAWGVPLFGLVLIGLARPNLPASAKVLLLLPAMYFSAVHAMSVGSLRYRVPVEPMLAVVAASALRRGQSSEFRVQDRRAVGPSSPEL